jgi:hypothetical protein
MTRISVLVKTEPRLQVDSPSQPAEMLCFGWSEAVFTSYWFLSILVKSRSFAASSRPKRVQNCDAGPRGPPPDSIPQVLFERAGDPSGSFVIQAAFLASSRSLSPETSFWLSWVGTVVTVLALVITVPGLVLTFRQARRAASEAEKIIATAATVERRASERQIQFLVPILQSIQDELERPSPGKSQAVAKVLLGHWRRTLPQVKGHIANLDIGLSDSEKNEILVTVQESVGLASVAKQASGTIVTPGLMNSVTKTMEILTDLNSKISARTAKD